jgi:IS605 OrfB family transposase
LAIDLGVDNLAACTTSTGASFLLDGLKLKSINQWYNKENARLQSVKDKSGIKGITNRQARLYRGRANRVRDYLNKSARYIINYCIDNSIGQLIVGYNPGIKQESNMGRHNNQKFVQIPHHSPKTSCKACVSDMGLFCRAGRVLHKYCFFVGH